MGWPAWFLKPFDWPGTTYVPSRDLGAIIHRHQYKGMAWRFKGRWSSYRPTADVMYKAIDRLDPKNEEDFTRIMTCAQAAGVKPPSSFTDLFLRVFKTRRPRFTPLAPFMGWTFGHWEWANPTYRGPVWQYDMNKAFRWASQQGGLPDFQTAYRDPTFHDPIAVYLAFVPPGIVPYHPVVRSVKPLVITSEERDFFGLTDNPSVEMVAGIGFRAHLDMQPVWQSIDLQFPYCKDRISKMFWGAWNGKHSPECVTWGTGREQARPLISPFYNPVWSAFITSCVKMRLANLRSHAIHIFADSLHSTIELPTDDEIGGWKLVGHYKDFWTRWAGHWGDGSATLKHSGIHAREHQPTVYSGRDRAKRWREFERQERLAWMVQNAEGYEWGR